MGVLVTEAVWNEFFILYSFTIILRAKRSLPSLFTQKAFLKIPLDHFP